MPSVLTASIIPILDFAFLRSDQNLHPILESLKRSLLLTFYDLQQNQISNEERKTFFRKDFETSNFAIYFCQFN